MIGLLGLNYSTLDYVTFVMGSLGLVGVTVGSWSEGHEKLWY